MTLPTVGFFGLGAMGYAMAGRLAQAGFEVAVADPQPARVEQWCFDYGEASHHPAEAAVVVSCVTDEVALRELMLGRCDLARQVGTGTLLIDHTTAPAVLAREIDAAAAARGAAFVDAPMSGGPEGAVAGTLSIMAGGDAEAIARAKPVMDAYAAQVIHLGAVGAGQLGKMANQVAIAGTVRGLAEAVALARAGGLDVGRVLDALAGGTAHSAQLARTRDALEAAGFRFRDTFGWLEKDLAIAAAESAANGMPLPLAALVKRMLEA